MGNHTSCGWNACQQPDWAGCLLGLQPASATHLVGVKHALHAYARQHAMRLALTRGFELSPQLLLVVLLSLSLVAAAGECCLHGSDV
jgi:hypothetical protein